MGVVASGLRFLIGHREPESPVQFVPTWRTETFTSSTGATAVTLKRHLLLREDGFYSQVGDPSFAHGAGDGLHRRAQRVQQRRQLPGAFCLPALLHDEAGHGDHVGVEGPLFGHGCR